LIEKGIVQDKKVQKHKDRSLKKAKKLKKKKP